MSAQAQPDRVVTLQRRRAEDGCSPTFTGPFTRTVPAASIDTALADVQHSLPAGAVVVQPTSAAAATSGPGRSKMPPLPQDRAHRRRVIEERVFRIAAFHNPAEARKAKTEVMSYRVLHEKIIENAEAQYGPEAEIPATFMPLSFLTDPPAEDTAQSSGRQEVSEPHEATAEARVAVFCRPPSAFSKTLLMPARVSRQSTAATCGGVDPQRCTAAVYAALKS